MDRTNNAPDLSSKGANLHSKAGQHSGVGSHSSETAGRVADMSHQTSGNTQSAASNFHGQQMNSGENMGQRQQQQGHAMSSQSGNHMGHQMNSGACDKQMGSSHPMSSQGQKQHDPNCASKTGRNCDQNCGKSC
ncbi:hypothetical protein BGZ93_001419 [Podila epicladia]|nr:hypothetical protein BGZ92_011678 [Podila epicladia]KAG0084040.1 hypothetical protein BGZ93_001419 [Podila epicladia]